MIRARISALVLAACACFVAASCAQNGAPCSAAEMTPGGVMFAHGLECDARVTACGHDGECKALVRDECDAWGQARCGMSPDGGEAGAP